MCADHLFDCNSDLKYAFIIRWKFTRGYVFDGNFSAEQLRMKRPEDDVHLTDGTGFLTEDARYQEHLKVAIEIKEVRWLHHTGNVSLNRCFRKRLVTNMWPRIPPIDIWHTYYILVLAQEGVFDMGVMFQVALSISRKGKSKWCKAQVSGRFNSVHHFPDR